jgi:D-3-phosphoglycerate dehydrogenase
MTPLDAKTLAELRSYLDVAYRLGLLLAQFETATIKRCLLQYRGEVSGKNIKLITASFAAGLLASALEEEINIVNAEVLLRERGVELVEQRRSDMGAFSSVVMAEVETSKRTLKAAGTVFGVDMLRLIQLDNFRLEAYLDGVLMVFTHHDVPGIIGSVGTIFGAHKINIAQMAVGRETKGGEAIGVLNLDQAPTQAALDEVRALPAIKSAVIVKLPPAGQRPAWLGG